jgi:hypothetical protein
VTTDIYQAWLSDRGIRSPVTQPFVLLGSAIESHALTLIVASAMPDESATLPAVVRLAQALKALSNSVSWIVVDQRFGVPSKSILRGILPTLVNIVMLVDDPANVVGSEPQGSEAAEQAPGYPVESLNLASRPLRVIFGPTMHTMSLNLAVKKRFWTQLQAWLLPSELT